MVHIPFPGNVNVLKGYPWSCRRAGTLPCRVCISTRLSGTARESRNEGGSYPSRPFDHRATANVAAEFSRIARLIHVWSLEAFNIKGAAEWGDNHSP